MQVEIKMLLGDTSDYHRLTSVLRPLFLSEESYVDYFFDFPSGSLTDNNSVLRLRVPCEKPNTGSSPIDPLPTTDHPTSAELGLHNESLFLSKQQPYGGGGYCYNYSNTPNVTSTQSATFDDFCTAPPMRQVAGQQQQFTQPVDFPTTQCVPPVGGTEPPRPYGKLVFKQNNMVERGHQMNFIVEDRQVPYDVVQRLIDNRENPFDVLREYAQRQEQLHGTVSGHTDADTTNALPSSPTSAAGRIVERLRYVAQKLKESSGGSLNVSQDNRDGDEGEEEEYSHFSTNNDVHRHHYRHDLGQDVAESNQYYGHVRYAAGAAAASLSQSREEQHRAHRMSCDLVSMGSYTSTRKTYHYLQPRQARVLHGTASLGGTTAAMSQAAATAQERDADGLTAEEQQEREWRSHLVIRVDKTLYPFGEKYEVEIPKVDDSGCGGLLEDVMAEMTKFLSNLQVKYQLGSEGKYQRFIRGIRSLHAAPEAVQDVKLRLTNVEGYAAVKANLERLMDTGSDPTRTLGGGGASSAISSMAQLATQPTQLSWQGHADRSPKRHIATTDLDTSGTQGEQRAEALLSYTGSTEIQENYFFDGPNGELLSQRCFLRLRRSVPVSSATTTTETGTDHHDSSSSSTVVGSGAGKEKYVLVLKENNTFTEGTQSNRTSKTSLSEDVARALLDSPGTWLSIYQEHNAVANALWHHFGLRSMQPSAFFTTKRITVPWWSARCQHATIGTASPNGGPGVLTGSSQIRASDANAFFTQAESYTQLRQQLQHNHGSAVVVPPLLIHLDCSQYRVPVTSRSRLQRAPFSQLNTSQAGPYGPNGWGAIRGNSITPVSMSNSTANTSTNSSHLGAAGPTTAAGEAFFELYEMEVTNITSAAPSTVMEELTAVLDGMGVEWQTGYQSKLDQYYALVRMNA